MEARVERVEHELRLPTIKGPWSQGSPGSESTTVGRSRRC